MYSKIFKVAVAATLFASANAHFFIDQPVPITGNSIKDPLNADGSNFPCHGSDVTQGAVTPLTAGATVPIKFDLGQGANTAVHGGGSCQISLTYETDAAKLKDPANWKVIYSFLGGCPTDAMGNLDTAVMCTGSGGPNCVNNLSFKVPAEVTNGNALLAWTWFNNIGNREMYMNCAKVSITGGTNNMGSLPAMFVANLASVNQCATTERTNIDFPNPGPYVQKEATLNYPLKAPAGTCSAGAGSANVPSTGGSNSAPAGGSSAAAAAPAATAASSANNGQYTGAGATKTAAAGPAGTSKAANNPGGVFAPGASAASPTATSVATTFITTTAAAASTPAAAVPAAASSPAAAAPSPPASGAIGACKIGEVACTASGFYCISATSFGMCNFGCALPQDVSAGTQCASGSVSYAANYPGRRRKVIRNVHRRHAAGSF